MLLELSFRRVGFQGSKIIVENKSAGIARISFALGARVAGTKVAGRIVGQCRFRRNAFDLTLPRSLRALRRNQHPFSGEGVQPAMGMRSEVGEVHEQNNSGSKFDHRGVIFDIRRGASYATAMRYRRSLLVRQTEV